LKQIFIRSDWLQVTSLQKEKRKKGDAGQRRAGKEPLMLKSIEYYLGERQLKKFKEYVLRTLKVYPFFYGVGEGGGGREILWPTW
jgi:hypothetical protein